MSTIMEMTLLQKIKERETMQKLSPVTTTATGCSQSIASFAQQRIWFDQQMHDDPSTSLALNNLLLPLVIKHGSMSIERIHSAIVTVLQQHMILRTALHFDESIGKLIQDVQPVVDNDNYSFQLTRKNLQSQHEIDDLFKSESMNHFAQLDRGLVVRCHLVKTGFDDDKDNLYPNDLIVFIFHPIAFDYSSAAPFIAAFTQAYDQIESNFTGLQYIDYTLYEYEQFMNVTQRPEIEIAQQFWSKQMNTYNLNKKYPLPRISTLQNKEHSKQSYSTSVVLDSNLVEALIEFSSLYDVSMFHIGLASFFILMYQLNDALINDLCITCPTENHPLFDMKLVVGNFTNLKPYRIKINSNDYFINFIQQIRQLDIDILQHFQLPYQKIINENNDLLSTKIPLHFYFDSICSSSLIDKMTLKSKTKDATLDLYTDEIWLHSNGIVYNDFILKMIYNQSNQKIYCIFQCSPNFYDENTLENIAQYFYNLLLHIFDKNIKTMEFDPAFIKIENLSPLQTNIQNLSKLSQQETCLNNTR